MPLKKGLKAALVSAIKDKGVLGAVDACRIEAQVITAKTSAGTVKMGRTALRLRNPVNTPAPWMVQPLKKISAGEVASTTVVLPDGGLGYLEAIGTKDVCVKCHGKQIEAGVKAAIAAAYPEDAATGFAPGDVRGAFWAVVPAAAK